MGKNDYDFELIKAKSTGLNRLWKGGTHDVLAGSQKAGQHIKRNWSAIWLLSVTGMALGAVGFTAQYLKGEVEDFIETSHQRGGPLSYFFAEAADAIKNTVHHYDTKSLYGEWVPPQEPIVVSERCQKWGGITGVPADFLARKVGQESGNNDTIQNAASGATGLVQMLDNTAIDWVAQSSDNLDLAHFKQFIIPGRDRSHWKAYQRLYGIKYDAHNRAYPDTDTKGSKETLAYFRNGISKNPDISIGLSAENDRVELPALMSHLRREINYADGYFPHFMGLPCAKGFLSRYDKILAAKDSTTLATDVIKDVADEWGERIISNNKDVFYHSHREGTGRNRKTVYDNPRTMIEVYEWAAAFMTKTPLRIHKQEQPVAMATATSQAGIAAGYVLPHDPNPS